MYDKPSIFTAATSTFLLKKAKTPKNILDDNAFDANISAASIFTTATTALTIQFHSQKS